MKKIFIVLTFLFFFYSLSFSQNKGINLYVSLKGNDSWSGTLPEPNKDNNDGPFATLEKAKTSVREYKKSGKIPKGGIVISIRGGIYSLDKTLELGEEDSGTNEAPIKWLAYNNEDVYLAGGKVIQGFEKISDLSILKRIDKKFQNKILQVNLKILGISDYGEITPRKACGLELFFNDKRMTLARYPNQGWLTITNVPQTGDTMYNKGLDREKRYDGVPCGRHYGRIKYSDDRPARWNDTSDLFAHGYWTFDWSDSYQRIKSIDLKNKEITFQTPHHWYGYTKNQRYYFVNILEELDTPGEWYLDRKSGILYFWPPSTIQKGKTVVSILDDPLLRMQNCQYVSIKGLKFEYSRGNGLILNGGLSNLIAGCTFTNLGSTAIILDGGTNNGITGCDIYDVAMGGIVLKGGDRKTLSPAGNFATNNHIHHYSAWIRSGMVAIEIHGVGNRLANNLIHDAPHEGIYVSGNDHILEYNEIHDVCTETGDAGAIHTGRDYTWRGNIYRFNYFHHLKGPGLHGVTAIYWDDFTSGYIAYGNICYKSGRGVLIGGGRDNIVMNNLFIDCHPSIVLDARGLGWASNYFDGQYPWLFTKFKEMNADQPPYSVRYPELKTIMNDQPAVPKNNKITGNISYNGRFIELLDYFSYDFSVITIKDNLIADPEICKRIKQDPKGWEPYYLNLDVSEGYRVWKNTDTDQLDFVKQNNMIKGDPGFVNYKKADFRIKTNSPAAKMGFVPIPIEKIGLYVDEYRKTLK